MDSQQGYFKATSLLKEHLGNERRTATAYMERTYIWLAIKSDNVTSLQAYAFSLRGYCLAIEQISNMEEIKHLPYPYEIAT